jgi:peptidoglycan/xylan/chitin deacetylase (PgdA/CDA1 family)
MMWILRRVRGLRRRVSRLSQRQNPIILMYHRTTALKLDPWGLAVEPTRFDRQIAVLGAHRKIVPLQWLARELADGRMPYGTAAVTFDDGYVDVKENAVPILERHQCPATLFITTRALDDPRIFWWDVLARIILSEPDRLPDRLALEIDGITHSWSVRHGGKDGEDGALSAETLHEEVYKHLRVVQPAHRLELLGRLAEWAGTDDEPRPSDRAMTREEVRAVARSNLIEIGAHTLTHPPLSNLAYRDQKREIVDSRRECEELVNGPVPGFAYPYGMFDSDTVRAADAAQLDYACTTRGSSVRRPRGTLGLYELPRAYVADWEEGEFTRRVLGHG